ncbi:MAG: class I SAM-dependent methyltransferase [Rhodospirillales bacterium]|nr:class I SAM-dependent methyltransferase [Rhodospirillales bacterium]
MTQPLRRRTTCRLCGGNDLEKVLALTPTPPANAFVSVEQLSEEQPVFPLDLFMCRACGHVQMLDVVDPAALFENYVYVSGTSPVFVRHFEDYANTLIDRFDPPAGSLVVDIGSNDGTLLRFFQNAGLRTLGIDPATEIARKATADGIETWDTFFGAEVAGQITVQKGRAAIVTANNVFAHADDLGGIVDGVRDILAPDGVFVFEVSYLVDVYEKTLFDTIYHEHLAYHSVKPLARFFEAHGMRLIDTVRVDTHGGSLRGIAAMADGPHEVTPSVGELIALEENMGLDNPETLRAYSARIDAVKADLTTLLGKLKAEGKIIAAFGAPAKATTLMYHFNIGVDFIDFIVDDSPLKQGLYSPGLHIPVVPSSEIYERNPEYLVLLAWNFAEPIMAKHAAFAQNGGRFIVPLPKVTVHP